MNEHSGNEGLFAAKLNQLQVPDLQDAIWDRITGMLDGMSSDTGPLKQSGKGNFGLGRMLGIAGISIAVISIILIERNTRKVEEQQQIRPTHQEVPVDSVRTIPSTVPDSNNIKPINLKNRKADVDVNDSLNDPQLQPRVTAMPDIQNSTRSFGTGTQLVDSISILPKDTISSFKDPRGIKGISDSSYRIVPGKKG